MVRFSESPTVEVEATIDAPRQVVWDLVTDINLSARFSSEFQGAEWLVEGPALEARFQGRNRIRDFEWQTVSWVDQFEPLSTFGWVVADRENPGSAWAFHLAKHESGTRLRYHRRLGPGPSGLTRAIDREPDREEEIVARRDGQHRESMQAVVDGVKRLAEGDE
jgi:uncharacterized protein YndB with AHSA1/START domain